MKLHEQITKSYDHPLSRKEVMQLVVKILSTYQKDRNIKSMRSWLLKNNFGDIQYNKWLRAAVDNLFDNIGGSWVPINTGLPIDKLTDKVMNHWKNKVSESMDAIKYPMNESILKPKSQEDIESYLLSGEMGYREIKTALSKCVETKNIDLLKRILDIYREKLKDYRSTLGDPLIMAAIFGNVEIINMLIDAGADPNFSNVILANACSYGHVEAAKVLLRRGAQVNRFAIEAAKDHLRHYRDDTLLKLVLNRLKEGFYNDTYSKDINSPKVYMRTNTRIINEDVAITDPTMAQQYLVVKKQITDKQSKKDMLMKQVNQVDNEINILQKNLLAIEMKATGQAQKQPKAEKTQQPAQQAQQPATNTAENQQQTSESFAPQFSFRDLVKQELANMDEDGNRLINEYADVVEALEKKGTSPEETALVILQLEYDWYDSEEEHQLAKQAWTESYIGGDTAGKVAANARTPIRRVDESVYDDINGLLDKELRKLSDIKGYIESINNTTEDDNEPYSPVPENIYNVQTDDQTDGVPSAMDVFAKTEEEEVIDETLKVEDKPPYVPPLVEKEDIETELSMLDHEEEDEPIDNYVFHIRVNGGLDDEIIAKVYKEDEDDTWVVRVVKGDEEPLQSMQFDERLNKLDIIGYIADIYKDVEIIDHKEYEYLLDDKEKVDSEYYDDVDTTNEEFTPRLIKTDPDFVTIGLDWAEDWAENAQTDEDLPVELAEYLDSHGILFIENLGNMGSGWPYLIFKGPREVMLKFLQEWYDDGQTPEEMLDTYKIS